MNSDILVIPRRYKNAALEDLGQSFKALIDSFLIHSGDKLSEGIAPSFFGLSGQGKTYAAAALANHFRATKIDTFWCSAPEDFDKLKNYMFFNRFSDWYILSGRLQKTSLLVIDDIAQVSQHKQLRELFNILVSKRYNAGLPTIFTGNLSKPTLDNFVEEISSCFSMAMCRRIEAMSRGYLHIA